VLLTSLSLRLASYAHEYANFIKIAVRARVMLRVHVGRWMLFFLFRMGYGDGVVFTRCDLSLLPHRWKERRTPSEVATYIFTQVLVFHIIAMVLRRDLLQINTALDLGYNNRQVLNYITSLLA
jgi:hypothetical protein